MISILFVKEENVISLIFDPTKFTSNYFLNYFLLQKTFFFDFSIIAYNIMIQH